MILFLIKNEHLLLRIIFSYFLGQILKLINCLNSENTKTNSKPFHNNNEINAYTIICHGN